MNIGKYIVAAIQADSALEALIGGRVFPVVLPQKEAYPAIVFTTVIAPADNSKNQPATTDRVQVRFHIWARKYADCEAIDVALRAALDYVTDTAGDVTVTGAMYTGGSDAIDEKLEFFLRESNYDFRVLRT